jgi:hypothetical protein
MKPHRLFQATPHTVAFDGIAMFLGNGEADTGFCLGFFPVEDFKQEDAASALLAIAHSKKLRAAFQPPGSVFGFIARQFARHLIGQFRP